MSGLIDAVTRSKEDWEYLSVTPRKRALIQGFTDHEGEPFFVRLREGNSAAASETLCDVVDEHGNMVHHALRLEHKDLFLAKTCRAIYDPQNDRLHAVKRP